MRYTLGDILHRPTPGNVAAWWVELSFRRNVRQLAWWRWLLFEPGQGWLRWGSDTRDASAHGWLEPYTVLPPARRVCMALRYRAAWPLQWRDEDRRRRRAW